MNGPLLKKKISLETSLVKRLTALAMFCLVVCVSHAQTTVSGRITSDEDASPIPGVNILLKGTALGTISDADGKYSLTVPESDAILVFSFVG